MMERVLASNEESVKAHRELFHCAEDSYRVVSQDLLASVTDLPGDLNRLHVVATWADILRLASWKEDPKIGDLFLLLKNIGLKTEELLPFREASVGDIFPWLYYGKRFDALRKICQVAKTNAERHMRCRDVRVYCHLILEDTPQIIASSL